LLNANQRIATRFSIPINVSDVAQNGSTARDTFSCVTCAELP